MASTALLDLPEFCFRAPPPGARWVQFDIALERPAGDALRSARQLFGLVVPWWETQARAGAVSHWFFMRKPPDVRLRVLATPAAQPAVNELAETLARAVAAGAIAGAARGVYRAEQTRFGGPAAMTAVHALFTLDSLLWYRLDRLAADGRRTLPAEDWLAAVFHDLFRAACGADVENAWRRLARHVMLEPAARPPPGARRSSLDEIRQASELDPDERALAATCGAGNARFGRALQRLDTILPAACPVAEVVATAAFFTCNRHGLPGERSRPIVARALAGFDEPQA